MIILSIIISLFLFYSVLIIYYWQSWRKIPLFKATDHPSATKVSIIIPARNEEANIGNLLKALQQQTYPLAFAEIIVIDDHSTDSTAAVVSNFPGVILLQLKDQHINSYKKKAIETGINAATGELIITTDADCIPSPGWLNAIVSFREFSKAGFIVAPVALDSGPSVVGMFQSMDFMILQGITGASVHKKIHSMCNGANLSYEKKLFNDVDGFAGIDHIASGDDMLLMHKIASTYPGTIHYLKAKDAIVHTQPMPGWRTFLNQRIRWASKATNYNDKKITGVLLLVYVFNLSFVLLLFAGFWSNKYWVLLAILWVAKTLVELPLMYSVASFFEKRHLLKYFFLFQPLHILYTVSTGLLGQFGSYTWKGRRVK
jgi:cellulose synthase/poly-beta-1,6-N-acetylglucosamine synthase-like glycosyltransferase